MNTRTATMLLARISLTEDDAARLVLETCEELGERSERLNHHELMCLLRRIMRAGIEALRQGEATVSFTEAVRQSLAARSHLRPTSRRNLKNYTNRMLRVPGVAARPLRAMNAKECRALLAAAFPNSPSSYHKGRAILHSVFAFGLRQEWCDRNPVDAVEAPRLKERPIEPLSMEEVQRLERTAERPEHRAMQLSLKLMLYCGVRPTEVTRLNPQRDIVGNELIIRPATSKTGGGRVIPLRKVATFIRSHRDCLVIPPRWEQRWRALRRAARFTCWQADVCRHTFATYHARRFKNLPALQAEMGHRDLGLLRSRYVTAKSENGVEYWR